MFSDGKPRPLVLIAAVLVASIVCAVLISKKESHGTGTVVAKTAQGVENQRDSVKNDSSPPEPTPSSRSHINILNQDIIRKCLASSPDISRVRFTDDLTLENLVTDLTAGETLIDSEVTMNVHVRRPNGDVQRLHVQPSVSEKNVDAERFEVGSSDVRVFNVDQESLPVPAMFDESFKSDSLAGVVSNFILGAQVLLRERRLHKKFGDGPATSVIADSVETNGRIDELQLFFGSHSLGCAWQQQQLHCTCIH